MITKIDIERFGLFSNYCWKQHIGTENNHIFSRILYMDEIIQVKLLYLEYFAV